MKTAQVVDMARTVSCEKHRCAAPECTTDVPLKMLMCWPHWRLVPSEIQRRVYATWKAVQGPASAHGGLRSRMNVARDYQRARDDAVAAVRKALGVQ